MRTLDRDPNTRAWWATSAPGLSGPSPPLPFCRGPKAT